MGEGGRAGDRLLREVRPALASVEGREADMESGVLRAEPRVGLEQLSRLRQQAATFEDACEVGAGVELLVGIAIPEYGEAARGFLAVLGIRLGGMRGVAR
jgi:hypothetical protein